MQRGKIALGYYVTNIFLLKKLLFRNPSQKVEKTAYFCENDDAEFEKEVFCTLDLILP
jgi:hypothetical protein